MDKSKKLLLGGAAVALFVGYVMFAGIGQTYGYATPGELVSGGHQGEKLSVMGNVTTGSIEQDTETSTLRFELEGEDNSVPVEYQGTLPANFGPGIKVVAKGTYDGEKVNAQKLIVKCPSKYQTKSLGEA